MEEAKTYILGDNAGNSALPWIAAMNGNNGGLLGGGLGSGFVGGIFGGLLSNVFGWGNGGYGGGNAGAAALGAQATANNNTDLLIQAVTSEGAQSRADSPKSIPDEHMRAVHVQEYLSDPDQRPGFVFNRFYNDTVWNGIPIDWEYVNS